MFELRDWISVFQSKTVGPGSSGFGSKSGAGPRISDFQNFGIGFQELGRNPLAQVPGFQDFGIGFRYFCRYPGPQKQNKPPEGGYRLDHRQTFLKRLVQNTFITYS